MINECTLSLSTRANEIDRLHLSPTTSSICLTETAEPCTITRKYVDKGQGCFKLTRQATDFQNCQLCSRYKDGRTNTNFYGHPCVFVRNNEWHGCSVRNHAEHKKWSIVDSTSCPLCKCFLSERFHTTNQTNKSQLKFTASLGNFHTRRTHPRCDEQGVNGVIYKQWHSRLILFPSPHTMQLVAARSRHHIMARAHTHKPCTYPSLHKFWK